MKALSIRQPWATLICCGLKDVENRKWALKSLPMRVLIHAGATRQPFNNDKFPYPQYWHVENYQNMGILPDIDKFPTSAVIGVATIDRCEEGNTSMWAQRGPGAEYQWVMKDVKMFKEPILGVKGSLGIFEIADIDENNLPEFAEIPQIRREGSTVFVPVAADIFEAFEKGETDILRLNLTDNNIHCFYPEDVDDIWFDTDHIVLECNGKTLSRDLAEFAIYPVTTEESDEDIIVALDEVGNEYLWYEILFRVNPK